MINLPIQQGIRHGSILLLALMLTACADNQEASETTVATNADAAVDATPANGAPAKAATDEATEEVPTGARAEIVETEAEVVNINYETREVSLRGPQGHIVTLTAGEDVQRLNEIELGDTIRATYVTSLAAELREPTEAELAMPWVVVTDEARADATGTPAGGVARVIRAVCTIEGMNRVTRTVMIEDPRGLYHVIGDIQPESFPLLSLGQSVIITYTEAVGLSLEKMALGEM